MKNQSGDIMSKKFLISLFIIILMALLIGCEQILNELDTLEFTVSETFLTNENATSRLDDVQTVPIVEDTSLYKSIPATSGIMMIPVNLPEYSILMAILEGGGCELRGTLENKKDNEVQFGIYFSGTNGLSNPAEQAYLIGNVQLGPNETKTIQGYQEEMLAFFSNPENHNISKLFVYLTGSPQPLHVKVRSMALVLSPCFHVSQTIQPSQIYSQYMNRVQSITNVIMCGSAKNKGTTPVTLSLEVYPAEGDMEWQGQVIEIFMDPGETIQFEDWASFLVAGGEERLEQCILYLVDAYKAIRCDLYIESEGAINVFINSLIFKGTVKVRI